MARRTFKLACVVITTFILQSFYGCVSHPTTQPISLPKLTVHDNTLLSGDQPYAELRYYGTANLSENRGETYLFSRAIQHRGIAIYYFSDRTLIWIYPKEKSWQEDVDRCCRSQTQGYFGWVFDVNISEDGQQIYYKTPGPISRSSWVYSVINRSSEPIDRDLFQKKVE